MGRVGYCCIPRVREGQKLGMATGTRIPIEPPKIATFWVKYNHESPFLTQHCISRHSEEQH